MRPYVVHTGDHLTSIAYKMGFDAMTVWNDPKNKRLRDQRSDPNILRGGDVLYIPEPVPPKWLPIQSGAVNKFTANPPKVNVSVAFQQAGKALANEACIAHGLTPKSALKTDGEGRLSFDAPVTMSFVDVEFPRLGFHRRLQVGHLDPLTETSGLVQRLTNLGHFSRSSGEDIDDTLADAVGRYQSANNLPVTRAFDEQTRDHLRSAHGC